jgi:hypothetical protein
MAAGSGDLSGITGIPLRDVRNLIGADNLAKLRREGLMVIYRGDFFRLVGDEKAAAATCLGHESHLARSHSASNPNLKARYPDAQRNQFRRLAKRRSSANPNHPADNQ